MAKQTSPRTNSSQAEESGNQTMEVIQSMSPDDNCAGEELPELLDDLNESAGSPIHTHESLEDEEVGNQTKEVIQSMSPDDNCAGEELPEPLDNLIESTGSPIRTHESLKDETLEVKEPGNQTKEVAEPAPSTDDSLRDDQKKQTNKMPSNDTRSTHEDKKRKPTEPPVDSRGSTKRSSSVDSHGSTTRDQEKQDEPSAGPCEPCSQSDTQSHYWKDTDIALWPSLFPDITPVSDEDQERSGYKTLIPCCAGHRASQGALKSAYIGLYIRNVSYYITFDVHEDHDCTMIHKCLDLYKTSYIPEIVTLLQPLCLPFWEEAWEKAAKIPCLDNLESVLSGGAVFWRLTPGVQNTATLEPSPPISFLHLGPCSEVKEGSRVTWDFALSRAKGTASWEQDWDFLLSKIKGYPIFQLSDIKHLRRCDSVVHEVEVSGKPMIYKLAWNDSTFWREVIGLFLAEKHNIRAPRLIGLTGVDTVWGGILISLIRGSNPLPRFREAGFWEASVTDRRRWFDQISDAVHTLHRNDGVWGDAKPANVLIDENRDAWLIDFEGGTTEYWVDAELADTAAGDLQALEKIREYLELDT
ncbi:hypothetical protein BJX99DRAFT_257313 [Aspergillus californicus]